MTELHAIELRFLAMGGEMPGAHVLVVGPDAADWTEQAKAAAPGFQFHRIANDAAIAGAILSGEVRHLYMLRHSGPNLVGILADMGRLLAYQRLDIILFGGLETAKELPGIAELLASRGYHLFGLEADDGGIEELASAAEGQHFNRFLAIQRRVVDLLLFGVRRELNLSALIQQYGIEIRGLVHLGAHDGQELPLYRRLGWFPIALIEAHPEVFRRLARTVADHADVIAVHAAVADEDGPVTLHLSTNDQCGSLLPMSALAKLVGQTEDVGIVEVPGRTLDSLFADWRTGGAAIASANMLVSDIQGAELLALQGAKQVLAQFDAVVLEISFDELYQDCAQVEEIDHYMDQAGFARVATVSTWHPGWSDGFYLRRR